jgi:hypothetical protein
MTEVRQNSQASRPHRNRVLKGATILRGPAQSEISCTVRNQHDNGAEIRVPGETALPERFLLYISADNTAYRVVVRWRKGARVGLQFVGREPKPPWHYGR